MIDRWRTEADRAWRAAAHATQLPSLAERGLLVAVATTAAAGLGAIGLRLTRAPGAPWWIVWLGVAVGAAFVVGPWLAWRATRRRAEGCLAEARARRVELRCPRCAAPLLARDADHVGERDCGACNARLLEAHGLAIAATSDELVRVDRWRAMARARFAIRPVPWALSARLWLFGAALGVAGLWGAAAALCPTGAVSAPLGLVEEVPSVREPGAESGTASARAPRVDLPAGDPSRPYAPLYVGTQVLAQKGDGPWHHLAVVVRARRGEAFVVYADGDSDWVGRRAVLAPELARGDAIEVWDGARFVEARVGERVGPALRVLGTTPRWTSAARMRVRVDAPHERGHGRRYEIPPGAWVEARVGGVWRPGLAVDTDRHRLRIALSHGDDRWLDEDDVRAQQIGPGARVYIDGEPGTHVVAARIGHALAVVDRAGARGWTSLARIRRVRAR